MKILKTIVATAVVVFALTTVAMAGVQHFTKQSSQAAGTRAQAAQPTYTVTLTAAQLAQLMSGGRSAAAGAVQHPRQAQHHSKAARHYAEATRDHARSNDAGASLASVGGSGGTHHHEAAHHTSSSGSGSHHAETSHHSGECGDGGGDCGD